MPAALTFRHILNLLVLCLAIAGATGARAQERQQADTGFVFENANPAWPRGQGPLMVFSGENSEFVQLGMSAPLASLAQGDGFQTRIDKDKIGPELLKGAKILVLINAFVPEFRNFPAMDPPSAFSDAEIDAVRQWISEGGSLLVLADHAPFGGGASRLAEAFGFTFLNGHLLEKRTADAGIVHVEIAYSRESGLIGDHPVTRGGLGRKPIDHFYTFGGQPFIPPDDAATLLRVPEGWQIVFSYRIARELQTAPSIDASGMAQGAVLEYGKGRIAVFGETSCFSAQTIDGEEKVGFNAPEGADNPEFILSVLRWLAGYQTKQ